MEVLLVCSYSFRGPSTVTAASPSVQASPGSGMVSSSPWCSAYLSKFPKARESYWITGLYTIPAG